MSAKKKNRGGKLFLIVVALLALGWVGARQAGLFEGEASFEIRGAPVRRGPLEITVTERGNLEAENSYSMKSEVEGRSTILFLIEEGTYVKAGDLVAELDATQLVDKRVGQEITVQTARAASIKAIQNLEIQKIANESLVANAEQQVVFAESDLEKFRQGDRDQQLKQSEEAINLAREERTLAENTLKWSQKLSDRGFVQRSELEKDQLAFERAEVMLAQAIRARELLEKYEHPKEEAQLEGNLAEARRQLRMAKLQEVAQLADFEAAKESAAVRLELEEQKLQKLEEQIAKARLLAPVDGMIVYGREAGGRMGGGGEPVKEGGEVRERQEIATIPGAGGMIAKASVHESVLKQVTEGLPSIVRIDALPGREFSGSVKKVAVLPDKNSWWANPNLRLYRTDIEIDGGDDDMRPGMSCNIEILVDMIEDTLYVPLQSVHSSAGRNLCWVQNGKEVEERTVEVGQHNEKWVAIESGLEEGEIVLLSPPPGFQATGAQSEGGSRKGEPRLGRPEKGGDHGAGSGESSSRGAGRGERTHGTGNPSAGASAQEHGGGGEGAVEPRTEPTGAAEAPAATTPSEPNPSERSTESPAEAGQ